VTVWPEEKRVSLAGERRLGAGRGPDGVGVGLTVGVGVGLTVDDGFTVSVAVFVTPAPETEIVTTVCVATGVVVMEKPPVVDPDGMVTLFGMLTTAELSLVSDRVRSDVAGEAIVTVPDEPVDPEVEDGLSVSDVGACWGDNVSCVCTVLPFHTALRVTAVMAVTALVGTLRVTD
jgi:hypothetical protein